ncbi:hypothetical protein BS064_14570 [Acinetobacter baumannii]|uniref:hypothetical protein n=1 Tax=Acinetobacter baumannii TaxID=470 RepID=UPI0004458011|nr:hypothetical protein [Acinetobacter baumannii]AIL78209.1 hypothetical protein IX87_06050 [Acinetobacter baumannii]APJ20268.1 hypothetical protein BS064_14570 [Acinetobacter baumannii]EKX8118668.1 hypothetical protein [Acinetobacter baumannii]EXD93579.1 hypothetical protein J490_3619 [Acinetobacter baumannii 942194]EYT30738.1 hypothetical protein J497_03813 [Acinetobacter baumannii 1121032]
MKPEQFIREYRVEKAREVVANQPKMNATHYRAKDKKYSSLFKPSPEIVYVADLKRLVESIDLVESWGGIEDLKLYDLSHCKDKPESAGYKLLKAIADYESIYGGGDE